MRIGVSVGEPTSGSIDELTASLQQAADDGFASAWLADLVFGLDGLTAVALGARSVPGIEVGSAVTPTYFRHPLVLARRAITVDIATNRHLVLGIGLAHQVVIESMLHLSFDRPAPTCANSWPC